MSGSWFRRRSEVRGTVAVFDIKNGSVGGALVVFPREGEPTIHYAHRATFTPRSPQFQELPALEKALHHVADRVCTEGLPRVMREVKGCRGVDHVAAFMGAPWMQISVQELSRHAEKPFSVTDRLIDEMLAEARSLPVAEALPLERSIIKSSINGYQTTEPRGKEARDFVLTVFSASLPKTVEKTLRGVLESAFHMRSISMRSSLLALFTVTRDHFESEDNFILMDVGSETTEIALALHDALVRTGTMPCGSHSLIGMAAQKLNTVPDEAISMLRMQAEGSIKAETAILSAFSVLEAAWKGKLDEALGAFKNGHGLPGTLFLLAPESVAPWIVSTLESESTASHTLTRNPFRIIRLDGEALLKHYHIQADVIPDTPLSLQTLFLQKVRGLAEK